MGVGYYIFGGVMTTINSSTSAPSAAQTDAIQRQQRERDEQREADINRADEGREVKRADIRENKRVSDAREALAERADRREDVAKRSREEHGSRGGKVDISV